MRTLAGSQPIESLKLGDQVLTQSIKTGALAYKPILGVHHNPPSKTFEMKLGDETIVSSHFHRFWKAGSGWAMARDLKVGDSVRTLNGTVKVTAIEDGRVVPVFNLDVAEDADFFVGGVGALRARQYSAGPAGNAVRRGDAAWSCGRGVTRLSLKRGFAMVTALVFGIVVVSLADPPEVAKAPATRVIEVYRDADAKAGKNADAHVRLALWCEAQGLRAERLKHLSLAVLYDPTNALARGLMGLVAYHGRWDRPDIVGQQIQNDPAHQAIVKEYLDRRARTPETPDAQMKLAAWCDEHGLKEQAIAHFTAVTRIAPVRDAAWKHLGYKKQGNRWVRPEEAAATKQEVVQQKQADKHWKTKLERLRDGLGSKDLARRAKAEQQLAQISDPRAVPMIWSLFVRGGERQQIAAVQMLGQIDGPSASNGLAALAVFSPAAGVRQRAIQTLSRRDPRDVVGRLIALIHKPYKYQVRHVSGPGSPGELFVEGERFNILRLYQNQTATAAPNRGRIYTPDVPFDPFSYQNIALATMTGFVANPETGGGTTIGKPGYSITSLSHVARDGGTGGPGDRGRPWKRCGDHGPTH